MFLVVLVGSALIAFALRNKLEYAVVAVIGARYFIPSSASVDFVPFLDPAVYLLAAVYLVQLIGNRAKLIRAFALSRVELFLLLALGLLAAANTFGQDVAAVNVISEFVRIYFAPVLLYVLIRGLCIDGPQKILVVIYAYLGFAVAQSIMAIIQDQQGELVVWESAFRRLWGGVDGAFGRSQGFTETGLALGTSLLPAIAFCAWVRSALLKFAMSLLFLYAMMLSSSRAALIAGIILLIVIAIASAGSVVRNILVLGVAAASVAAFVASGGADVILNKFADDGDSTAKRIEAYTWFPQHLNEFLIFGYQGNRDFRVSQVLSSSLENAFFMAAVNYGLVFAVILLILLLFIAFRSLAYGKFAIVAGIALIATVAVENTNSGFASLSFSGYALWMLAGICSYGAWRKMPDTRALSEDTGLTPNVPPRDAADVGTGPGLPPGIRREAPYRRYLTKS